MKKNIFVTGGGGFIGSHLLEKLVTLGHKVKTIVPYNKILKLYQVTFVIQI